MSNAKHLLLSLLSVCLTFGCNQQEPPLSPFKRGTFLILKSDFEGALAISDEMLAADANDYQAVILRGKVFEKQVDISPSERQPQDYDTALEAYNQAVRMAPQQPQPYQSRSDLYVKMAELVAGQPREMELLLLANTDKNVVAKHDPDAAVAYSLLKPRDAAFDYSSLQSQDTAEDVPNSPDDDENSSETGAPWEQDPDDRDEEFAVTETSADTLPVGGNAPTRVTDSLVESAADYAARKTRESAVATVEAPEAEDVAPQKEPLEDPLLPPHNDPFLPPVTVVPETPITRFSLPVGPAGDLLQPSRPGGITTGISQQNTAQNPDGTQQADEDAEPATPLNRFYLQDQFGASPSGFNNRPRQTAVRTGIGSSRSTTRSTSYGSASTPAGFLPPEARNSFGPRLALPSQRLNSPGGRNLPGTDSQSAPQPQQGTAIITTALPGSTMIYGATGSARPYSFGTARNTNDPRANQLGPRLAPQSRGIQSTTTPDIRNVPILPPVRTSN